jgi:methionine-rich copper-binding protein CopC
MKKIVVAVLGLMFIALPSASAHTELTTSYPANGDVVSAMPSTVSVEFSENLMLLGGKAVNTVELSAPNGSNVPIDSMSVIQNSITADIAQDDFINGDYTLHYAVVAQDGHKVSGEVTFTLSNPDAPSPEASLLIAPAPSEDSHGVATGVLVAVGVLVSLLILAIAYRRFSGK